MDKVDQQALDVRAIVVLIGHDHEMTVSELLGVVVRNAVLQAEDLLDGVDLLVLAQLYGSGLANVQQLTAERKDAILIATDDREARDGESLGTVSLGQDQSTILRVARAGVVGVIQLLDAGDSRRLLAVLLAEFLVCVCQTTVQDLVNNVQAQYCNNNHSISRVSEKERDSVCRVGFLAAILTFLDESRWNVALASELGLGGVERLLGLRVERRVLDQAVHKHEHVLLDDRRLEHDVFVLLGDTLEDLGREHTRNVVDMLASARRADTVDEAHLIRLTWRASVRRVVGHLNNKNEND